jgi:hypothetical protein
MIFFIHILVIFRVFEVQLFEYAFIVQDTRWNSQQISIILVQLRINIRPFCLHFTDEVCTVPVPTSYK